ncbi:hypothetical protein FORC31_p424 (plasmid) [Escherichia coli]|uniref:Uncharacterized protein n=1 Tax=Shigella dysenteriae 1 TaxID=984897 RepID=A0A142CLX7_SHIDY|nr:hypothetical protein [Shigella dysenteriae 1]AOT35672.1 hypothetical protein FORC31_p424 [Escherichia coli]
MGILIPIDEHANDVMTRRQQRVEMTRCKVRCTRKNNT